MTNPNFTYGKTLSSLITLLLTEFKQTPPGEELTTSFIAKQLAQKNEGVANYIELDPVKNKKYLKLRVRNTLKELAESEIVEIEEKKTVLKTTYYTFILK